MKCDCNKYDFERVKGIYINSESLEAKDQDGNSIGYVESFDRKTGHMTFSEKPTLSKEEFKKLIR